MTFEEKFSFATKELEIAKIWKSNYNPPFVKLIHKLGFKVPPPHYNSFLTNALSTGIYFGLVWGLLMYFLVWKEQGMPIALISLATLFAGTFFGVGMASYYKYSV
ncbi:DUF6404 family protein [Cellvibrio polysaccharolyticus]|uniref:Uncharacterized protein n=1 Tax=Cellvibrio polysaccharolyticus TaxID=2082724 RepID=A0A928UZI5_9GAMM|nr:DUF6404 family protein [Cellvibrio polysaccharolyticus]MBE8715943.1 hypothetical protein [Cellvibrio polysaccharolyticus]